MFAVQGETQRTPLAQRRCNETAPPSDVGHVAFARFGHETLCLDELYTARRVGVKMSSPRMKVYWGCFEFPAWQLLAICPGLGETRSSRGARNERSPMCSAPAICGSRLHVARGGVLAAASVCQWHVRAACLMLSHP